MFGWTELLIIAGVVVLLFGASKLPKLARATGESVNEFKKGLSDDEPALEAQTSPEQSEDAV